MARSLFKNRKELIFKSENKYRYYNVFHELIVSDFFDIFESEYPKYKDKLDLDSLLRDAHYNNKPKAFEIIFNSIEDKSRLLQFHKHFIEEHGIKI